MSAVVVNEETGEITEALDAATARDILEGIKLNLADTAELIEALWTGRGWIALGHGSWDALVAAEIRGCLPRLDRAERKAVVAELAATGMSQRAIASAVGVSVGQVNGDLGDRCSEMNTSPAPTTGLDGKTYPSRKPAAPPLPAQTPEQLAKTLELQRQARVLDATQVILAALHVLATEGISIDVEAMFAQIQSAIRASKESAK